jgi:type IV pilus assembly protein PilM
MTNKETLFFKDKPIFGLDVGYSSVKVLQAETSDKKHVITGYGAAGFTPGAVKDGVIVDPETIAKSVYELFDKHLIGDITTRRVVLSIPAARSYNRNVHLPKLGSKELKDAVSLEVEQYIPVPANELYVDFSKIRETAEELELLIVAVPQKIVDSYLNLAKILGLEVVGVQTSIAAGGRLFLQAESTETPTVLIDFGSLSSDLTIYDHGLIITSTVAGGGDNFTDTIASTLNVTKQEAHIIKTKYGLGVSKKQREITDGLTPTLQNMTKEIKRMIRYYEERTDTERKITQVVTMGGGANMPGLSEYMTNLLRIPVRMCDPWQNLKFGNLQPPNSVEKSMYVTVAGLALTPPQELFS